MTYSTLVSKTEKFLWVQDVHFGTSALPPGVVAQSFKYVVDVAIRKGINRIVIGGDITDQPLTLINDHASEYVVFVIWLLKTCEELGIEINIIEGTPSHDWKQARLFEQIKEALGLSTKLVYINTLSIIYLEGLGNVLIVPDQWRTKATQTFTEILTLLKERELDKVDYAFMHGSFKYQMPKFLRTKLDLHDEEEFCKIVDKAIFVGHDHHRSNYKKIYCAGSLERSSHGQEEDKGAFFVEVLESGKPFVEFIKNIKAQVYRDLVVDGLDAQEILDKFFELGIDLEEPSHVRLVSTTGLTVINEFIKRYEVIYDTVKWSSKDLSKKGSSQTVAEIGETELSFSKINLDITTISTLLSDRIRSKHGEEKAKDLEVILNEVVEEVRV